MSLSSASSKSHSLSMKKSFIKEENQMNFGFISSFQYADTPCSNSSISQFSHGSEPSTSMRRDPTPKHIQNNYNYQPGEIRLLPPISIVGKCKNIASASSRVFSPPRLCSDSCFPRKLPQPSRFQLQNNNNNKDTNEGVIHKRRSKGQVWQTMNPSQFGPRFSLGSVPSPTPPRKLSGRVPVPLDQIRGRECLTVDSSRSIFRDEGIPSSSKQLSQGSLSYLRSSSSTFTAESSTINSVSSVVRNDNMNAVLSLRNNTSSEHLVPPQSDPSANITKWIPSFEVKPEPCITPIFDFEEVKSARINDYMPCRCNNCNEIVSLGRYCPRHNNTIANVIGLSIPGNLSSTNGPSKISFVMSTSAKNRVDNLSPEYSLVSMNASKDNLPLGLSDLNANINSLPISRSKGKKRKDGSEAASPKRCQVLNCMKLSKVGGRCIAHGGGKRCQTEGCVKLAEKGGHCIAHGGGRRCKKEGCTKSDQGGGLCKAHGGGRRCRFYQCPHSADAGGLCISHGGGKRCKAIGCSKGAVGGTFCKAHGGGRKCRAPGCSFKLNSGKFCPQHAYFATDRDLSLQNRTLASVEDLRRSRA